MKAIMLMFDSLNRHMLEPYGCDWVKTPNFKRLSEKCVTFDRAYVGSLPCMPARRELHTGRYNFLHRSWGPLEPFDESMPQILSEHGIYTHLISDHIHYWEEGGATYHQRYNTWEIVRGQEGDCWKASVVPPEEPEHYGRLWIQDEINRQYIKNTNQYPISQVYQLGLEFLETNREADNWFLQIESFDPHEPFFTPDQFKNLYEDDYNGKRFDWPAYQKVEEPDEAVLHCRKQYAALVSECDHYVGKILDFMDLHNMWEDTMLIVNTDHGFLLSEHDWWAKGVMPLYEEISHIPLFIWDPRAQKCGVRNEALVQTIDIAPTILDYFQVSVPPTMQGKPLTETIHSEKEIRHGALFGMHGSQINMVNDRYVYMRKPEKENRPLYEYTLMPTHMRGFFGIEELEHMTFSEPFTFTKGIKTLKVPARKVRNANGEISSDIFKTFIYDLKTDEKQEHPITDEALENKLKQEMIELMKESEAPEEQYLRMGLGSS